MRKSELYAAVMSIVATETEISVAEIEGGGKTREVVDARYMAVYFLNKRGFHSADIVRMMGISQQAVSKILNNFGRRLSQSGKIFEISIQRIHNKLTTTVQPTD